MGYRSVSNRRTKRRRRIHARSLLPRAHCFTRGGRPTQPPPARGASDHGARGAGDASEIRERLISSHQEFLALVHRRVGSRTLAEGIRRDAFGAAGDELASASDEESAVSWFIRKLREA